MKNESNLRLRMLSAFTLKRMRLQLNSSIHYKSQKKTHRVVIILKIKEKTKKYMCVSETRLKRTSS